MLAREVKIALKELGHKLFVMRGMTNVEFSENSERYLTLYYYPSQRLIDEVFEYCNSHRKNFPIYDFAELLTMMKVLFYSSRKYKIFELMEDELDKLDCVDRTLLHRGKYLCDLGDPMNAATEFLQAYVAMICMHVYVAFDAIDRSYSIPETVIADAEMISDWGLYVLKEVSYSKEFSRFLK